MALYHNELYYDMAVYPNAPKICEFINNDCSHLSKTIDGIDGIDNSNDYSEQSVKFSFDEKIKQSILLEKKWKYRMKKWYCQINTISRCHKDEYSKLKCLINAHTNVKNFIIQRGEELDIEKSSYLMENIPLCKIVDEPNKK